MADLDSQPKPILSLYSWYSEGKLFVNRRYQRKLVWTLHEKQKLIESVLKRYPVPALLLAERAEKTAKGDKTYEVIDGLQRLQALVSFIECAFPTLDGRYFDVGLHPTAANRESEGIFSRPDDNAELISAEEVTIFLDYVMAVSVMGGATEAEIDDVFGRINTYGHRLSDQERRQAGVRNNFSRLVRELACEIRGDASSPVLGLEQMPSISIDLPKTKHGYQVIADEIFWVEHGVLRSTDLRDSMDEQCIADIAASIVGGEIIERSKDALDEIYESGTADNARIENALRSYGSERFAEEFKQCIDEIRKVCDNGQSAKLRTILFKKSSTNAFAAVFAVLLVAFHESLFKGGKKIADYAGVRSSITGLYDRIDTSRGSTSPEERRKNINVIKGLIGEHLVDAEPRDLGAAHSTVDIDNLIRRSAVELPDYELKQGLLQLTNSKTIDPSIIDKVIRTICAIANNARPGTILIGVTDKPADADRIKSLYGINPRVVGDRHIVGYRREADALGEAQDRYLQRWTDAIRKSDLSEPLKSSVLSSIDSNDYYGMGIIIIPIPKQSEVSYVGEEMFCREGNSTIKADSPRKVSAINQRFR
ncbi:GmrSD restriction endonuclease domain-containing protein [Nocardia beijingensis]